VEDKRKVGFDEGKDVGRDALLQRTEFVIDNKIIDVYNLDFMCYLVYNASIKTKRDPKGARALGALFIYSI